jgi:hypothetical protein
MSLATDSIFVAAVQSNAALVERVGGRIYGTAIPLPDEDADNVPVPYVILTFDGLNNDDSTKDQPYEGDYDKVNIGVEVTAKSLNALHELTQIIRKTILDYIRGQKESEGDEFPIDDYQFSAQAIQFDSLKPCYWQVLNYQCDVRNDLNDEQD